MGDGERKAKRYREGLGRGEEVQKIMGKLVKRTER